MRQKSRRNIWDTNHARAGNHFSAFRVSVSLIRVTAQSHDWTKHLKYVGLNLDFQHSLSFLLTFIHFCSNLKSFSYQSRYFEDALQERVWIQDVHIFIICWISNADDKQPNSKKHGIFLHIVFGKRGQRVGMYLKFNFCLLSKFKVLFMHQLSCLGRPLLLGGDFDSTLIFAENNSLSRISILGH